MWPNAKRALEFAWIENGWDGNRDGVAEGVQHNTYDVEFYGPNPLCGIYYLGALRAGEEMARVVGDQDSAAEYHRLFVNGSRWFDQNLFNGEYYIQKVEGRPADQIAPGLRIGTGAANTLAPDYQMGDACLADQLLGQMLAHVAGLGYLLDEAHVRATLKSILQVQLPPEPERACRTAAHLRPERRRRGGGGHLSARANVRKFLFRISARFGRDWSTSLPRRWRSRG